MFTVILVTLAVFIFLILLLTSLIIGAEMKLVNHDDVTLTINGKEDEALTVESGKTLLDTLSEKNILLPSACGGQGTCGVCECKVTEGGGDLLPTETTHVSRKEAREGVRLACQVKVKEDMKIVVPDEIFSIKKWDCEVVSNDGVATYIKEFVVRLPEGEHLDFKSGGYIQIEAPAHVIDYSKDIDIEDEYKDEWKENKLYGIVSKVNEPIVRAYSMANHPAEGNIIMLNVRVVTPPWDRAKGDFMNLPTGQMSSYIFSKKPGDTVTISGPYGEFFINETENEMMYIGGGAGMAPLRSHIFHLFHTLKTGRRVTYWYGARSQKEIFYWDDFKAIEKQFPNFTFNIGLSDEPEDSGWDGYRGFIHQIVEDEYLYNHDAPEDIEYYLCGPGVMTDAVTDMLYNLGVEEEKILYDKFD